MCSCSTSAVAKGERESMRLHAQGSLHSCHWVSFPFFSQRDEKLNAYIHSLPETYYTCEDMQISHQDEIIFSVKLCSVNILSWILFCPNTTSTRMTIVISFCYCSWVLVRVIFVSTTPKIRKQCVLVSQVFNIVFNMIFFLFTISILDVTLRTF